MIELLEHCKCRLREISKRQHGSEGDLAYDDGKAAAYTDVIDQLRYLANKILEKGNT